jgi:hypothetical protein
MSQYYRMEVEITPLKEIEKHDARFQLEGQGMHDIGEVDIADGYAFYGHMSLAARGPDEMHKELKELFPDCKLSSRWLNLDVHGWDVEIDDDSNP